MQINLKSISLVIIICITGVIIALLMPAAKVYSADSVGENIMLIDDFSGEKSKLGTSWEGVTDQVMGGRSLIQAGVARDADSPYLHLGGTVSLENNGGFIQVRLFLSPDRKPFDASSFTGLEIRGKGVGEGYYVHIRTPRTWLPWAYYVQPLPLGESWETVQLPFADFVSENMTSSTMNPKKIVSIAFVAAKKEFQADLDIDYVALY